MATTGPKPRARRAGFLVIHVCLTYLSSLVQASHQCGEGTLHHEHLFCARVVTVTRNLVLDSCGRCPNEVPSRYLLCVPEEDYSRPGDTKRLARRHDGQSSGEHACFFSTKNCHVEFSRRTSGTTAWSKSKQNCQVEFLRRDVLFRDRFQKPGSVKESGSLPFAQRSRTDNIYAPSITDVLFATRNQPEVIEPEPCHPQGGDGLSQSVSVCLGLHRSVSLCLGLAVCVFVRLRLSVCVFACLCQSWSVGRLVGLGRSLPCLFLSLFVSRLSVGPSVCRPVCRSVCRSVCLERGVRLLSVCLCLFVCRSVSVSLGPSVWVCLGLSGSVSHVRVVHVVHVCVPSTTPLTPRPPSLFTSPHTSHPLPSKRCWRHGWPWMTVDDQGVARAVTRSFVNELHLDVLEPVVLVDARRPDQKRYTRRATLLSTHSVC